MSLTAAEMARIMVEEWDPDAEPLDVFALRRFRTESVQTFCRALEIGLELIAADKLEDELRPWSGQP